MYSTTSAYPSFDLSTMSTNSGNVSPQNIDMESCLNSYQSHDSVDYSRRSSYFTGLLSSSDSNLSDQEQQTPSPLSAYENYQFSHPLDNSDKRRLSTLVELPQMNFQSPDYSYSTTINPWFSSDSVATSRSPMMYANPSIDMYSPQAYMGNSFHPLCSSTPSNDNLNVPLDNFRERASSACSTLSDDSSLSMSPPTSTRRHSNKSTVKRSRGRRVSNSPSVAGQKVFKCTFKNACGKVFKRSEHLKRHIRSIHTQEKPYKCPYETCSKNFSRSDNLNQHIRIHRHTGKDKTPTHRNTFNNFMPAF